MPWSTVIIDGRRPNADSPVLTALLADIHANSDALAACLRHARAAGAKRFVFLGDLVGYNADPAGTLVLVRELPGATDMMI